MTQSICDFNNLWCLDINEQYIINNDRKQKKSQPRTEFK